MRITRTHTAAAAICLGALATLGAVPVGSASAATTATSTLTLTTVVPAGSTATGTAAAPAVLAPAYGDSVGFTFSTSARAPRGVVINVGCRDGWNRLVYYGSGSTSTLFPMTTGTIADTAWDGSPAACEAQARVYDRKGASTLLARTFFTVDSAR